MAYVARLIDCTDAMSAADRSAVATQLTTWIAAADSTRPPSDRSGATVGWVTLVASPTAANLIIYFVSDQKHSVLRFMRGFHPPPQWERLMGLTYFYDNERWRERGGVRVYTRNEHFSACEVYCTKCNGAADLAMFAFHEAMHNQLHMGNEMHDDPVAGGGIAAETILSGTTPTPGNLAAFGTAMGTVRAQWVDGYARAHPTRATHPLHPHH
jgi:hypothetical protein